MRSDEASESASESGAVEQHPVVDAAVSEKVDDDLPVPVFKLYVESLRLVLFPLSPFSLKSLHFLSRRLLNFVQNFLFYVLSWDLRIFQSSLPLQCILS